MRVEKKEGEMSKKKREKHRRAKFAASDRVAAGLGINCPTCHRQTQKLMHSAEFLPKNGAGYYRWWYECVHGNCRTKQIMPKEAFLKGYATDVIQACVAADRKQQPQETPREGNMMSPWDDY